MEDDQEISAYLFRRTVPSLHLSPDDVRWMVGLQISFYYDQSLSFFCLQILSSYDN